MGRGRALVVAIAALAAACETIDDEAAIAPHADPRLDTLTWSGLQTFESEAALTRYIERVRAKALERGYWWASRGGVAYAALEAPEAPCDPTVADCPDTDDEEGIVVTGSSGVNPQITNVQTQGVDEGDIVKQIDDFLIVLQDGRLFSVDTRPGDAPGLRLADRADVYRSAEEDTWYDEVLVFDRRIVVTGYSYDEEATEFSVYSLDDDGRFTREAVFYMSSNDYYDVDNYATRLVGDRLVIHSPIRLEDVDVEEPYAWPVVRRWRAEDEGGAREGNDDGRILFDARDVYKPVQRTMKPVLHTVSVCRIGAAAGADDLDCATTGLIGPGGDTFYVSPTDAWLWLTPAYDELVDVSGGLSECVSEDGDYGRRLASPVPGALFRIPLDSRKAPGVLGVRGFPTDQLAMDADSRELRALVEWTSEDCGRPDAEVRYFRTRTSRLQTELRPAPSRSYVPTPNTGGFYEVRFTGTHVVYAGGARSWWGDYPPRPGEPPQSARVVAAPLDAPKQPTVMTAPHGVIRLERAGDHIVMSGYRDDRGLTVSALDLRDAPRLADTLLLEGRYESEGRTHAFNSRVEADGSGVLGVPTVLSEEESGRLAWRSELSDVSFLTLDREARLAHAGELTTSQEGEHESYACEVSCVEWYGNSRPIFTAGRIFALSGTEIIEGTIENGRIHEARRVDLTAPPPGREGS